MDNVTILPYDRIHKNFIDSQYLHDGHDEFYFRNLQAKMPDTGWRHLRSDEIERLVINGNTCSNWDDLWVTDIFDTNMVRNNHFFGMVRIGRIRKVTLQYHDLRLPAGITGSSIISCDIGDDVAIHDVHYMANYIIGDRCILFNIQEISNTNHAKFGNGIIKEGEPENVRIWMDVMNENGGRAILPFDGMITADAYLWAKYADNKQLQTRLKEITQNSMDSHRGYYGTIGEACVIKNTWILKDAKIGPYCYIKGANKLKNITVNSSKEEPTQIGEGVIMVNGIAGYGCHIFYSAVATRFVLGDNCTLKYGARVVYSVLGDNSTISCCEVLNNLIFPAHEQHHNNSFLISACVMGQSNMAAGATIGSNHNSRATDGEIVAGRGFWPGLCSSVKHSSKFASFTLLSKGDYPHELNIQLPFSLVNNNVSDNVLEVMPAYWWMYNMFAIARNAAKYRSRDIRKRKIQHIEFESFAPDTIEEVLEGRKLLELWTAKSYLNATERDLPADNDTLRATGKQLLEHEPEKVRKITVYGEGTECSKRKVHIIKPVEAYNAYADMIVFYAVRNIALYLKDNPGTGIRDLALEFKNNMKDPWVNMGGQLMHNYDVQNLIRDINSNVLNSWDEIHGRYDEIWDSYPKEKLRHSYFSLLTLYGNEVAGLTDEMWHNAVAEAKRIQQFICDQVFVTRKKDYDNEFRNATFRNEAEKDAVIGKLSDNAAIKQILDESAEYLQLLDNLLP